MGWVLRSKCSWLLPSLLCLSAACSNKENKTDSVIAVEGKVFDITIQSSTPDSYAYNAESALVGQADNGSETRLLLAIPNILSLFHEDVVLSSIAHIEIQLFANDIAVNPDNIRLGFISQKWTPYATWNSRFSLGSDYDWDTPGGDLMDLSPVTPDIEKAGADLTHKKLVFNVTASILTAITTGQTIQGFLLHIVPSADNAASSSQIFTSNHSHNYAPKAVLTFNKGGILIP